MFGRSGGHDSQSGRWSVGIWKWRSEDNTTTAEAEASVPVPYVAKPYLTWCDCPINVRMSEESEDWAVKVTSHWLRKEASLRLAKPTRLERRLPEREKTTVSDSILKTRKTRTSERK